MRAKTGTDRFGLSSPAGRRSPRRRAGGGAAADHVLRASEAPTSSRHRRLNEALALVITSVLLAIVAAIPAGASGPEIAITAAGVGIAGFVADGGYAWGTEVDAPDAVAYDLSGDLYIADTTNNRIRMIPASSGVHFGQTMIAGNIYTIAGTGTACATHTVSGCSYNGIATSAKLDAPAGVAVDSSGDLFVADSSNNWVGMIPATTGTYYGIAMTADGIYDIAGTGTACSTHTVSGCSYNAAATSAKLDAPKGVAVDAAGDVVVADTSNNWIGLLANQSATLYGISMSPNSIYDIAGTGTACATHTVSGCSYNAAATSAKLDAPAGVGVDSSGDIAVADSLNQWVGLLANQSATLYGISMSPNSIYDIAGTGTACATHTVAGCSYNAAATSAKLDVPIGVAFDSSGDIAVADSLNQWVGLLAKSTG